MHITPLSYLCKFIHRFQTDISVRVLQTVGRTNKPYSNIILRENLALDLPTQGPHIIGVADHYLVGDTISATCLSPLSEPEVSLSWYINHDSAHPRDVSSQTRQLISFQDKTQSGQIRSPLKYDTQPNNYFSLVKLNLIVREKQLRIEHFG